VGLSSLGDDQFDGLGRVRKAPHTQENTASTFPDSTTRMRDARTNNVTAGRSWSPRTPGENRTQRNNNNKENGQRAQNNKHRHSSGQSHSQRVEPAVGGRKDSGAKKESGIQQVTDGIRQKSVKVGDKPRSLAEALGAPATVNSSSTTTVQRKPQQPRAYQQIPLTDFSKLVDTAVTKPNANSQLSSKVYLVGTPTLLEQQAGDYSRYLEQDIACKLGQSTKLSPVDNARATLARRPDVTLEERAKAIQVMSIATGSGSTITPRVKA
jgi:hypothetical protein